MATDNREGSFHTHGGSYSVDSHVSDTPVKGTRSQREFECTSALGELPVHKPSSCLCTCSKFNPYNILNFSSHLPLLQILQCPSSMMTSRMGVQDAFQSRAALCPARPAPDSGTCQEPLKYRALPSSGGENELQTTVHFEASHLMLIDEGKC